MEWTVHVGPNGEWAWTLLLTNGWVAGVADRAHDELPTSYIIYAGSQTEIIRDDYLLVDLLADAKMLAIKFALEQPTKPMPLPAKRRKSRVY